MDNAKRKLAPINTVKIGNGRTIKIVAPNNQKSEISSRDAEMDIRAIQAVKFALAKAEVCKKPVAKYDKVTKRAYVEYADGERKYVE